MKKIIPLLLLVSSCQLVFSQVKVSIKGDLGTYLSVCTGCQQVINHETSSFNSAMVHATDNNGWFSKFTMEKLSNGNYTFKDGQGGYMGICTGCVVKGTQRDFITFHTRTPELYCQFELTKLANGKYLIKNAQNGLYVARCNGCSPTSTQVNQVAAHAGAGAEKAEWAQWEIIFL